ncbi:MAG: transcription initiation factor IIB [Terrestrivirus sp.]|uniref:Transcription initiation factor IIB n=1 Tax=Terrestrivirus sp. TaxID=2487775 RepID=A0A3G4ZMF9_9VIRU|nr:MAG: transcription initiation factor IIB [Terrestrivirus sp.]
MINNIDDLNNLTDADLRDIFDNIEFSIDGNKSGKKAVKKYDICPFCLNPSILEDGVNGIIVCTNNLCGQVIDVLLDQNPEWRQYEDDGTNNARCAMPINQLLPQSSLGTSISGNYKSRLKTLQTWGAMPYRERSLNNVFKKIHELCQKGNIIKCIEDDAKIYYKTISDCKHIIGKNKGKHIIIRGKNRASLIAACVFFACRRNGKTRTPKEIADLFGLKYTEITKGCKNFMKLMKIRDMGLANNTSQPEHFVIRFCNELKLSKALTDQVIQIAKNIRKLNIASVHTPSSTATCSILLMAEINKIRTITKKRLAQKFNVSEVTISKAYNKIEMYRKALIDDNLTEILVKKIEETRTNAKIPDFVLQRLKKFSNIPANLDTNLLKTTVQPTANEYPNNQNNQELYQIPIINNDFYGTGELYEDLELEGFDDDDFRDTFDDFDDFDNSDESEDELYYDEIGDDKLDTDMKKVLIQNKYIIDRLKKTDKECNMIMNSL